MSYLCIRFFFLIEKTLFLCRINIYVSKFQYDLKVTSLDDSSSSFFYDPKPTHSTSISYFYSRNTILNSKQIRKRLSEEAGAAALYTFMQSLSTTKLKGCNFLDAKHLYNRPSPSLPAFVKNFLAT